MNSARTLELALSKAQLKDHIENFMRANGMIHDHEDITIGFDPKYMQSTEETIPLTIGVRNEGKGYVIEH